MKANRNFEALLRLIEVSLKFTYEQVDSGFDSNLTPTLLFEMRSYFREKYAVWLEKGGNCSEQFYYTINHPIDTAFNASLIICVSEYTLSTNIRMNNEFMKELVGRAQICLLLNQSLGQHAPPFSPEDVASFKTLEAFRSRPYMIAENGCSFFSRDP